MEDGSQYSIHSICRICLVHLQTDNAYDLFMTPGLAKKLCVCTSLSVEPQDGFPKNLCGICYGRLNDLHDFQKLCVDSVQKFQEMVANNTFACMPHVNTFDILEEPNTDDHDGQNFDDDRINFDPLFHHKMEIIENEDEVVKMLEHVDKEEEESEKEQENKDKDNNDQDNENLNLNTKFTSESSSSSSSDEFGNDDDDEDYAANESVTKSNAQAGDDDDDDSDSSDDDMPLALRLRKRRGGASATTTAARRKPTKVRRKRDPKAEKQQVMIIDCHICHQKFKKPKCYQEHMKYHNDKLPYQCSVETCQKGFTTANGLRMHVDHAHSELSESHACPEEGCGQVFPRSRLLTWHLRKVHNKTKTMIPPKMHPCPNCEKIFRCPMALKKHMYKHDGKELPFPCNICGKRFVINSALKEHLMRHAGIKNYVCPYCGVGKTTRQEWNNHINMHTQEKRYQCHLCEHSSHNKQALTNHVRVVHEKIKNYACQYCGKTFGKSHACKIHEMTHTGEKRCECKVCGKRFLYPKSLTKHLKTHEKRVLRAIEVYRKRQEEMGQQATEAGVAAAAAAAGDAEAQLQQAQQTGDGQAVVVPGQGNPIQPQAPRKVNPNPKPRAPRAPNAAGTVNRTSGITRAPPIADTPNPHLTEEILKACAESVATIPRDPRRVERVDISQLAGTSVNPIPQVSVPSWSPQVNFTMKEGKHICPGCGKGFNNIGNMKRHYKIIHEKVKDFACRFCERRFAKAQTLRHHEMTHTGEKPYECKVCMTRFRQDVALKRHMKVHQNKPPVIPAKFYAAREELALKEREELDAKRKLEEEKAAITARAREQLKEVKKAIELEKLQKLNMYNNGGGPPPDADDEDGQSGSSKKRGNTPEKFFATQEEAAQKELEEAEAKKRKELKREAIAERAREQLAEVKMQIENRYNTLKYTDLEQPKREFDESDGDDDDEEDEEDDEEDDVAVKSEPNVSGSSAAAPSGSNASAAADISSTTTSSAAVGCASSNLPNSEVFAEFNNMGMPCSQTSATASSDQPPTGAQEFMPEYSQHNV